MSSRCSTRWARPIHGSGQIVLAQSDRNGIRPRSSRTCYSPLRRTSTTRPSLLTIAVRNIVSSKKMPSAVRGSNALGCTVLSRKKPRVSKALIASCAWENLRGSTTEAGTLPIGPALCWRQLLSCQHAYAERPSFLQNTYVGSYSAYRRQMGCELFKSPISVSQLRLICNQIGLRFQRA
jgi:hypothetical protein